MQAAAWKCLIPARVPYVLAHTGMQIPELANKQKPMHTGMMASPENHYCVNNYGQLHLRSLLHVLGNSSSNAETKETKLLQSV